MRNWLPVELAGSVSAEQLRARGLYELMRAAGVHLRVPSSGSAPGARRAAEASCSACRRGAPLLTMERTTYDGSGRAVELGRARLPGGDLLHRDDGGGSVGLGGRAPEAPTGWVGGDLAPPKPRRWWVA